MSNITLYLKKIVDRTDLTFEESRNLLDTIFGGDVEPTQVAAFLAAMRVKGGSVGELAGLASSLREHASKVDAGVEDLVDTCGTGGANVKIFNISTASAIVSAAAGVRIAKHGNRSITSKSGSADVLEELGVNIDPGSELIARCIRECGIGFIFAPKFHPAMKYVQPVRKSLGFRTVFNVLGPLANPAGAKKQVIGVAELELMEKIAETLKMLGLERAMVVHSEGLDEVSTMGPTKVLELNNGEIADYDLDPTEFGIARASYEDLKGGDAQENARIIRSIFTGKETGPKRDIVVVNSAAAILISGIANDYKEALGLANAAIDDKKASETLQKFIDISNSKGACDV